MTIEEKKTESSSVVEQPKETNEVKLAQEQPKDAKKIAVDIGAGVTVELDIEQGKKYIAFRDSRTKSYKEIEAKLKTAEEVAKNEASRAQLIEAMKKQSVDEVENMVSAKYKDTIDKFQTKVFKGEIKATLSKLGIIAEGIDDAAKLVLADAKAELDGDDVKLNGIKAEDYLKDWTSRKPHLLAVTSKPADGKKKIGKTDVPPVKPERSSTDSLKSGLGKFLK
jgi:hypothetical protein